MPRILWCGDASGFRAVDANLNGTVVWFAHSDLQQNVQFAECDCVVIDLRARPSLECLRFPRLAPPAVLLTGGSDPSWLRQMPEACALIGRGCVSLRGRDDLRIDIATLLCEHRSLGPELRLINAVPSRFSTALRSILIAGYILGRRRALVGELARQCGLPVRTLQSHLASGLGVTANDLLGWSLAMHTLWRLDIRGQTLKSAALEAGYASPTSMADYIKRHVGERPRALADRGGFEALLERWRGLVTRGELQTC